MNKANKKTNKSSPFKNYNPILFGYTHNVHKPSMSVVTINMSTMILAAFGATAAVRMAERADRMLVGV